MTTDKRPSTIVKFHPSFLPLLLVAILVLIGWRTSRPSHRAPKESSTLATAGDLARKPPAGLLQRNEQRAWMDPADPVAIMLGDQAANVKPSTRARLLQAYRCAEFIQQEIETYPPDPSRGQVIGLQRLLFSNDFKVAAWSDPALDIHEATNAYHNLAAYFEGGTPRVAVAAAPTCYASLPPSRGLTELQQNYDLVLHGRSTAFSNEGYLKVLEILHGMAPQAPVLNSMLFHDACVYADFVGMFAEWRREDARIKRFINAELRGEATTPEALQREETLLQASLDACYAGWERSYRAIYAYRFRDYYGLDGDKLASLLERWPLPSTWNTLRVPCP